MKKNWVVALLVLVVLTSVALAEGNAVSLESASIADRQSDVHERIAEHVEFPS